MGTRANRVPPQDRDRRLTSAGAGRHWAGESGRGPRARAGASSPRRRRRANGSRAWSTRGWLGSALLAASQARGAGAARARELVEHGRLTPATPPAAAAPQTKRAGSWQQKIAPIAAGRSRCPTEDRRGGSASGGYGPAVSGAAVVDARLRGGVVRSKNSRCAGVSPGWRRIGVRRPEEPRRLPLRCFISRGSGVDLRGSAPSCRPEAAAARSEDDDATPAELRRRIPAG